MHPGRRQFVNVLSGREVVFLNLSGSVSLCRALCPFASLLCRNHRGGQKSAQRKCDEECVDEASTLDNFRQGLRSCTPCVSMTFNCHEHVLQVNLVGSARLLLKQRQNGWVCSLLAGWSCKLWPERTYHGKPAGNRAALIRTRIHCSFVMRSGWHQGDSSTDGERTTPRGDARRDRTYQRTVVVAI